DAGTGIHPRAAASGSPAADVLELEIGHRNPPHVGAAVELARERAAELHADAPRVLLDQPAVRVPRRRIRLLRRLIEVAVVTANRVEASLVPLERDRSGALHEPVLADHPPIRPEQAAGGERE